MKMKIDADLTPIQRELFQEATKIAWEAMEVIKNRSTEYINNAIVENNGLQQTEVYSFFGKILNLLSVKLIQSIKNIADEIGDNEITMRLLFDEMMTGNEIMLGLKKFPATEFKRLNS